MKEISGSFLSDKDKFSEINKLNNSNVDYIHVDVMDGKFVSNSNITPNELPQILDKIKKPIDIHLMVSDPLKYLKKIVYYNISYITIHYETKQIEENIEIIKNFGFRVGISVKPETAIEKIYYLLDKVNLVLIMSVEPGESGQQFISSTTEKINKLKQEIIRRKLQTKISVDGGINNITKDLVSKTDIIVSASYILNDINNIDKLR